MKARILLLLLLLLSCNAYANKPSKTLVPSLFSYEPEEKAGTPVKEQRYFREIKRTSEASLVEYNLGPGSVAGPMFMVKGMCGLMRARGKKVAQGHEVLADTSSNQTRITFPNLSPAEIERQRQLLLHPVHPDSTLQPEIFSLEDCNLIGF